MRGLGMQPGAPHVMKTVLIAAAVFGLAPALPAAAQPVDFSKQEVRAVDLGHGLWYLGWTGGDSLVLTGPDGALLVDTSVPQMSAKIAAAVARVSDRPIRFIVNTHGHADHFGGNEALAKGGAIIIGQQKLRERMASGQYLAAFNQTIPPSPPAALPTVTYADAMTLHLDGETVELIHTPAAHTDNDTIVFFRRANVAHMSGAFGSNSTYPFFDSSSGGSLNGVIAAQERVLGLADANTKVVADEGDPESRDRLQASHDMLVKLRARVQALIDQGKTEAEVIAAKPTADLDPAWVPKGGFLTGDVYVRMAYQSLKGIRPAARPPAPARTN
jgi:glyoxylase-like metal-dependent hydrolase (beta-lactamase superfamily II)